MTTKGDRMKVLEIRKVNGGHQLYASHVELTPDELVARGQFTELIEDGMGLADAALAVQANWPDLDKSLWLYLAW